MAKEKLNLTLEPKTKQFLKILAINKNKTVSQLIEEYVSILNKSKELDLIHDSLVRYKEELELSIKESRIIIADLNVQKKQRDEDLNNIESINKILEYIDF